MTPNAQQAAALEAAHAARCMYGQIPVGYGKTLLAALLPEALGARRALLLLPGSTRRGTLKLRATYGRLPECEIRSYEAIGHPQHRDELRELAPDVLILDEAHAGAGQSTRARRISEYLREHPETRVAAMSGTLLQSPIARACLAGAWVWRGRSPLPLRRDVAALQRTIDGEASPLDAAQAVAKLARNAAEARAMHLGLRRGDASPVLAALAARVAATPGGVVLPGMSCNASIRVEVHEYAVSAPVADALAQLESTWELPGAIYADAMQVAAVRRQLCVGFYYRWASAPSALWLRARREWAGAVRRYLQRPRELDSEGLITAACLRGDAPSDEVASAWRLWGVLRSADEPVTEPVWLDRAHVARCARMARERAGLLWCQHTAEADASALTVIPAHRDPSSGACAVSTHAHGVGRNLQHYAHGVLLAPLDVAGAWEQLLGRTHRQGQRADEVVTAVWTCEQNRGDLEAAVTLAKINGAVTPQRLLLGLCE